MESERPAEPGSPAFRCVVWHAPGGVVPADLTAALGRRHMGIEQCAGPMAALAEVCALDREVHDEGRPGVPPGVILVLVEAESLPDAPEVLRAVELYAPRVRCWRYEPGAADRLRAVGSADLAPEPPVVIVMPEVRQDSGTRPGAVRHAAQGRSTLRLAGNGSLPVKPPETEDAVREDPPENGPRGDAGDARQVLTPEELTMLLSEDIVEPEDSAQRRPGPRAGDQQ